MAAIAPSSDGWVLSLKSRDRVYGELEEAVEKARQELRDVGGGVIKLDRGPNFQLDHITVSSLRPGAHSKAVGAPEIRETRAVGGAPQYPVECKAKLLLPPKSGPGSWDAVEVADEFLGTGLGPLGGLISGAMKAGGTWADGYLRLEESGLRFAGHAPPLSSRSICGAINFNEIDAIHISERGRGKRGNRRLTIQVGVPVLQFLTDRDDEEFVAALSRALGPVTRATQIEESPARPESLLERERARYGVALVPWRSSRRGDPKAMSAALRESADVLRGSVDPRAPADLAEAVEEAAEEVRSEATLGFALVASELIEAHIRWELDPVTPPTDSLATLLSRVDDRNLGDGLEELCLRGFAYGAVTLSMSPVRAVVRSDITPSELYEQWGFFRAQRDVMEEWEDPNLYETMCRQLVRDAVASCRVLGLIRDDEKRQERLRERLDFSLGHSGMAIYFAGLQITEPSDSTQSSDRHGR